MKFGNISHSRNNRLILPFHIGRLPKTTAVVTISRDAGYLAMQKQTESNYGIDIALSLRKLSGD